MLKKYWILFICICVVQLLNAQVSQSAETNPSNVIDKQIRIDKSHIQKKSFDTDKLQEYRDSGDFNYEEVVEPSIFEALWNWIKQVIIDFLSLFFDNVKPVTGFLSIILNLLPWIILVIAILLIVKYFVKINVKSITGNEKISKVEFLDDEDLIKNQDLYKLLREAKEEKNFRLAIRFYYLLVLQKFTKVGLIDWQQQKTNEDYIKELHESDIQQDFEKTTRLYDFVWYGSFDISENEFTKSEKIFQLLINQKGG